MVPACDERAATVGGRRSVRLVSLAVIQHKPKQCFREGGVVWAVVDETVSGLDLERGDERTLPALKRFAPLGERHLVKHGMLGMIQHQVDADDRSTVRVGKSEPADDFELWRARLTGIPALPGHPGFEIVGNAGHGHL